MSTTTRHTARWYAEQIDGASAQAQSYHAAAAALDKLAMSGHAALWDEVRRLRSMAAEMAGEVEALMDEAAEDGWMPQDLWG